MLATTTTTTTATATMTAIPLLLKTGGRVLAVLLEQAATVALRLLTKGASLRHPRDLAMLPMYVVILHRPEELIWKHPFRILIHRVFWAYLD